MPIEKVDVFEQLGGRVDVACASCSWGLPPSLHARPRAGERPGSAEFIDQAVPAAKAHSDDTGHRVRFVIQTFHADYTEVSSYLGGPTSRDEQGAA